MRIRWTKENLEPAVLASTSMSEVLDRLGLRKAGGNYQNIKNRIKFFDISTDHFDPPNVRKIVIYNKQRRCKPEEAFVKDCKVCRGVVKRLLISNNLKPYQCRDCGVTDLYNGKKIVLQLEHINGIYNDNRLDNLCFLCPNCHSQTATYAGKNTVSKRNYSEVGELIDPLDC